MARISDIERRFADHEKSLLQAAEIRFLPREDYASDKRTKIAMWLAIASLITAVLTLIVVLSGK